MHSIPSCWAAAAANVDRPLRRRSHDDETHGHPVEALRSIDCAASANGQFFKGGWTGTRRTNRAIAGSSTNLPSSHGASIGSATRAVGSPGAVSRALDKLPSNHVGHRVPEGARLMAEETLHERSADACALRLPVKISEHRPQGGIELLRDAGLNHIQLSPTQSERCGENTQWISNWDRTIGASIWRMGSFHIRPSPLLCHCRSRRGSSGSLKNSADALLRDLLGQRIEPCLAPAHVKPDPLLNQLGQLVGSRRRTDGRLQILPRQSPAPQSPSRELGGDSTKIGRRRS